MKLAKSILEQGELINTENSQNKELVFGSRGPCREWETLTRLAFTITRMYPVALCSLHPVLLPDDVHSSFSIAWILPPSFKIFFFFFGCAVCMWDLSSLTWIEPVSPAVEVCVLTTGPPRKSLPSSFPFPNPPLTWGSKQRKHRKNDAPNYQTLMEYSLQMRFLKRHFKCSGDLSTNINVLVSRK